MLWPLNPVRPSQPSRREAYSGRTKHPRGESTVTTRKRKPKSRSGSTIPESERRTVQVNARVPRAVRARYEAEAERRGLTLGALVRERLEDAPWALEDES